MDEWVDFGLKEEKCFKWHTVLPTLSLKMVSENFMFQDIKCFFELRFHYKCTLDNDDDEFCDRDDIVVVRKIYNPAVSLRIISDAKLSFPFEATVYVETETRSLLVSKRDITKEKVDIWTSLEHRVKTYLNQSLLKLRVVLQNDDFQEKQPEDVATNQKPPDLGTNVHLDALCRDFSKLLKESSSYDVKIACGGKTFNAHRIILEMRSPVFSAMLKSKSFDSKIKLIKVEDVEASVFESFLQYLYAGTLPKLNEETARQFNYLGDKYGIEELKKAPSHLSEERLK